MNKQAKKVYTNRTKLHWGWCIPEKSSSLPTIDLFTDSGEVVYTVGITGKCSVGSVLGQQHLPFGCTKDKAIAFTKKYSIPPSVVAKVANGVRWEQIFNRHKEWFKLIRTKDTKVPSKYAGSIEAIPFIEQAVKDKIKHLIPIIALFKAEPKEIKKALGSTLWKGLCKNSYSRNRLILQGFDFSRSYEGRVELINNLQVMPSSLLKSKLKHHPHEALKLAKEELGISYESMKSSREVRVILQEFMDTKRMLQDEGVEFNPNWSYRRLKEEHTAASRRQQEVYNNREAQQNANYLEPLKVDFSNLHTGLIPYEFDSGVKAVPLLSVKEVQAEGSAMHHCVGSYANDCAQGCYVVYSLEKDGQKSTLGIIVSKVDDRKMFMFNQHYGKCNALITDKDVLVAGTEIVNYLNTAHKESIKDIEKEYNSAELV